MHVVRRLQIALGLAGALVAAVGCLIAIREAKPKRPAESDYVNPSLCAGCHPGIAKTYALTGMGRSFYRPRVKTTVEDYTTRNEFYHRASGLSVVRMSSFLKISDLALAPRIVNEGNVNRPNVA
jgi:hypothetical protein